MSKIKITACALFFPILFSCKKDSLKPAATSSVTLINGTVGSAAMIPLFGTGSMQWFSNAKTIGYGSFAEYPVPSATSQFTIYQATDTVNGFSLNAHGAAYALKPDGIYSIFLCGQIAQPDVVFTEDKLPYHAANDSSIGIRFINLSPGSSPVNITLSTDPGVNEFSDVAYKSITDFKNYPALASTSLTRYIFQFRDAATNSVLASFTMNGINNNAGTNKSTNNYRFRNFTFVLKGLPGASGDSGQGVFLVNNY